VKSADLLTKTFGSGFPRPPADDCEDWTIAKPFFISTTELSDTKNKWSSRRINSITFVKTSHRSPFRRFCCLYGRRCQRRQKIRNVLISPAWSWRLDGSSSSSRSYARWNTVAGWLRFWLLPL